MYNNRKLTKGQDSLQLFGVFKFGGKMVQFLHNCYVSKTSITIQNVSSPMLFDQLEYNCWKCGCEEKCQH